MRVLAVKYSDLGNHEKALHYINRAESLSQTLLSSLSNSRVLDLLLAKADILLKKLRFASEKECMEPIKIAEQAVQLAKQLYGDKSI